MLTFSNPLLTQYMTTNLDNIPSDHLPMCLEIPSAHALYNVTVLTHFMIYEAKIGLLMVIDLCCNLYCHIYRQLVTRGKVLLMVFCGVYYP